jgi:hypothetical protein
MNLTDLIIKLVQGICNLLGKLINLFLEKTFLQIIVVLWALSHFHSDFFKYSKFGIFINGTDNITTHDNASISATHNTEKPAEKSKK